MNVDGEAKGKSTPLSPGRSQIPAELRESCAHGGRALTVPCPSSPGRFPSWNVSRRAPSPCHLRSPSQLLSQRGASGIDPTSPSGSKQPGPARGCIPIPAVVGFSCLDGSPQAGHSWNTAGFNRHSRNARPGNAHPGNAARALASESRLFIPFIAFLAFKLPLYLAPRSFRGCLSPRSRVPGRECRTVALIANCSFSLRAPAVSSV